MDEHELNPLKYPPNSKTQKSNTEKPKLEKIVSSEVKMQKKSIFKRLSGSIFTETPDTIGGYIVKEVLVPYAKDVIYDTIVNTVSMALYSNPRAGGRRSGRSSTNRDGYIQYGSFSSSNSSSQQKAIERPRGERINVDNVIFGMSAEAHEVLDAMCDRLEHYGTVTVLDLCDLIGVTSSPNAMYYGWTDISEARVRQINEGWLLDLPRPKALSR